jgi:hypothetical protein
MLVEDISALDVDGGADDQPATMPLQSRTFEDELT